MARSLYSVRFFAIQGLTASQFYSVPAGHVAVIRDADAYRTGIEGATVFLVGPASEVIWAHLFDPGSASATAQFRGRQVINEGETIHVESSNPVDLTVSGYLLTLP